MQFLLETLSMKLIETEKREISNVDLTSALVDLIAAQRNLQANAKAIENVLDEYFKISVRD
mgnify:CR=1 FL=1